MTRHDRGLQLAVLIAAAAVSARLLVWLLGTTDVTTWEYEEIAQNLLAGRGYGLQYRHAWYRTIASPPFGYLCALLYLVFGHHHVVVLVAQWLFSAATTFAAYVIGARLFSPGAGVLAAGLVAFHPGILYYDTHHLHPLSFDAALVMWSIVGLLGMPAIRAAAAAFGVGVLHGLAVLERTTLAALPLASLVWLGLPPRAGRTRLVAIYLAGVAVLLAPWMARSLWIYGDLTLNSFSGELLWRGNNPLSDGGSFAKERPGVSMFSAAPEQFRARILAEDETGQRQIFHAAATEFIRTHPTEALKLFARKLVGFWWFMPQSGLLYPPRYLLGYQVYYAIVAAGAAVGVAVGLSGATATRLMTLTILAVLLSISVAQAVFYVEIRHRWSVEPVLLVFAAAGAMTACKPVVYSARTS